MRRVSADTSHRLFRPLSDLLVATYGSVPVLTELLSPVAGVEQAFFYGSWAARYAGEPGPVPRDLDVLVVGGADLDDLDEVAREARARLGFEVNVSRVSPGTWNSTTRDPFLAHVRSQPLVELDIEPEV